MPRHVDHTTRRAEITSAAMRILARGGTGALTLKSLAEELGGSITLVTHFISNRTELFMAIVDDLTDSYDAELEQLDAGLDGVDRLWRLLTWMAPTDPDEIELERARLALISHRDEHSSIAHFFQAMERRMRGLLEERLVGLVPAGDQDDATAYLRAVVNGLTLSAVEHPDLWPASQVERALRTAVLGLGLEVAHPGVPLSA